MTIETDIVNWARTRPTWQRAILRRVARGDHLDDKDYRGIVDKLCEAVWKGSEAFEVSDFPATSPSAGQVSILAIKDIDKVNALVKGQELRFAPEGLTLVFGENGSGKSGYARLIKAMVRTRHRDIFSDPGTGTATAVITLQTDGDALDVSWPEGDRSELNQILFYDEACGDAYLTREAETTYRPHTLFVMDGLIRACDGVREELDRRVAGNRSQAVVFPKLDERTTAAQLLEKLSSRTTKNDIETACNLPDDVAVQIERFKQEEARLAATNPAKEKARLQATARHFDKLAEHVAEFTESLGDQTTACLREAHAALRTARAASMLASEESFEDEPIGGVGTAAWRSLWEAARHFAVERVLDFPPASPHARCVLCHQELDEEASDRLKRFDAFIKNETQQNLDAATKAWKYAVRRIETLDTTPAQVLSALDTLGDEHSDLIERYRSAMHTCVARRDELLKQDADEPWSEPATSLPKIPANDLAERADKLRAKAGGIDDESFAKEIESAASERRELEAKVELAKYRKFLVAEVQRLRELEKLEQLKGQADTRGVSRKAAEITREHVTTVMRDRFTRETERLRLERVTLADAGGPKGALRHQPAFVGAVQRAPLPRVLSEGEQTALGLAGFFTEAYLDQSKSAIILDDPVSSLDHVRRGYVAVRLVQFAKERQVIVFTHDISFVTDLVAAARDEDVVITERAVEKRSTGQPGICMDKHPWKAKDARQRLGHLREALARIRKGQGTWDRETYEREACDWAGSLSETWERIVVLEVVGQVIDRGTQEVKPRMFRLFSRITEQDDRDFQASYWRCSRWARRHDKSVALNYVAPTVDEMEGELDFVQTWFDRVRKYAN